LFFFSFLQQRTMKPALFASKNWYHPIGSEMGRSTNLVEDLILSNAALSALFGKSGAGQFGVTESAFRSLLQDIAHKNLSVGSSRKETQQFFASLHVEELALAHACAAGNETAWEAFLLRYREKLYSMALHIAKEDAAAHELADSVYAELFGLRTRNGQRVSKLASYTGRGSLEGWLRTVLAQQHIDRYRTQKRLVSLEDRTEEPAIPASAENVAASFGETDSRLEQAVDNTLRALSPEERFILAAYYLDGRTLVEIACMLGVHASSVSRRIDKVAGSLRKRVVAELVRRGVDRRRAEELLETDVRDLRVNVRKHLAQKPGGRTFPGEKVHTQANAPES
jgi:RNA polymerase sigma-70 factor (ECF subfamily)